MIIVEGPDGAGKTTLIKYLVEKLELPVAPRVVSKDAEAMVDLKKWVEDNVSGGWQPTIFDRHRLISEPIYGPILRPRLEEGFTDVGWFYEQLRRFYRANPTIIYCLPPFRQVWENVQDDPDNRVVAQQHTLQMIWSSYFNKAITEYALKPKATWLYDYTDPGADKLFLPELVRHINMRRLQEGF